MKKQDIDLFNKGRKVAEDISSVMLGGEIKSRENFDEWLSQNKYSKQVIDKFANDERFDMLCHDFTAQKQNQIDRLAKALDQKRKKRISIRIAVTTTAAAVAVLSFLLLDYGQKTPLELNHYVAVENARSESKPMLITSIGEEIVLVENTTLNDGGAVVVGDHLKYDTGGKNVSAIVYNKLVLPHKSTFSVELSDGTKVYLNANSTLEYPTQFSGNTREITLTGEAFFDVTKDETKPFIVKVAQTKIQVYGTKFNVNSYNGKCIKTALVSGSVGVRTEGRDEIRIVPGQILLMNPENGEAVLNPANTNKYEAWLNGYFRCDNEEIEILLEDIAQWYGVEFFFESPASRQVKISASLDRKRSIEEVLELLSITSELQIIKKGGIYHIVK